MTVGQVTDYCADGTIPATPNSDGGWSIHKGVFREWIEELRTETTATCSMDEEHDREHLA